MKPKTKTTIEQIEQWRDDAVKEWIDDLLINSPYTSPETAVKARVAATLDKRLDELAAHLMGFRNSWGKWEMETTNGVDGKTPVGSHIKKLTEAAVASWVKDLKLAPPSKKFVKIMEAYFQREFESAARRAIAELAERKGTEITGLVDL